MNQLTSIDWQEILEHLKNFATSESARELLQKLTPLKSEQEAEQSFREITEFQNVLTLARRTQMPSLDLCSSWLRRLEKQAVLKNLELRDVRQFCQETLTLKETLEEVLQQNSTPHLTSIHEKLFEASAPLSAIDQLLTADGDIRSDASETLFRLSREKKNLTQKIEQTLNRLVKDHDLEKVIQDRFVTNREGRWVLPIKSGKQHDFSGIVHASSQSKQTVFMEPQEITPMNNRLRQIETEIQDEINALLKQLSDYLFAHFDDFQRARATLIHCDFRFSQAQLNQELDGHAVKFTKEEIALNDISHPLLLLGKEKVVTNSVKMAENANILLLSGPNAGGKTVLLKSIGLAAQMARCGLPICAAQGSSLPFFKDILIAVGDDQSVDQKLSTFAAHLGVLALGLKAKGHDHLILIDEICGSTDPEEGSALARSFIEAYAENKAFAVITSHLGPLKSHWQKNSSVVNGSLEYDRETGQPTYLFISGVPGHSQALQTARRIGIDSSIIERAYELLSPETKNRLQKLDEIEVLRDQLQKLQKDFYQAKQEAIKQKNKFKSWLKEFQKEKEARLSSIVKKTEAKMNDFIAHAKVDNVFKKHEKIAEMKRDFPQVIKSTQNNQRIESAEEFSKKFPPGTQVFVKSIGKNAIVQSTPSNKGQVSIQAASMRLQVPWQELSSMRQDVKNHSSSANKRDLSSLLNHQDALDLRGKTAEEAIELLEIHLDRAMKHGHERLKVIHGHGSNVLKKTVRAHLSRSVYVQNWSSGGPERGDDGVTWVEIVD